VDNQAVTMTAETESVQTFVDGYVVGNIYQAGTVVDWTGPVVARLTCAEEIAEHRSYPVIPLRVLEVTEPLAHALGYLVALRRPTPQRPEPHLWLKHWGLVHAEFWRAEPRGPEAVTIAVVRA
jgi:hypothetical protein